jgi:hypothetical protein
MTWRVTVERFVAAAISSACSHTFSSPTAVAANTLRREMFVMTLHAF